MFFLQMAGFPGSGKSTLAKEIANRTGAIIIDHDVSKTALLESMDTYHLESTNSGNISYHLDWAMIDFLLSLGHSVIFDSPCFYSEMVERGTMLAEKHHVKYKYIECLLNNVEEITYRLSNRKRMRSQIKQIASVAAFNEWINNSKKPSNTNYLVVESGNPLYSYIDDVINYLNE